MVHAARVASWGARPQCVKASHAAPVTSHAAPVTRPFEGVRERIQRQHS